MTDSVIISKIPSYFKRLPKNIQILSFECPVHKSAVTRDFSNLAKSLRYLQNLQSFDRHYYLGEQNARNRVENELQAYSQSVSRLKNTKKIGYSFSYAEGAGFQRLMRRGNFLYKGITELKMRLSMFTLPGYMEMTPYFDYEDSVGSESSFDFDDMNAQEEYIYGVIKEEIQQRDNEASSNDLYNFEDDGRLFAFDQDFAANCQMREEIKPFYRFELFPNLKILDITLEDHLYPLGSFVVDGFKSLQNLEELSLDVMCRSAGTGYFFKGFLELLLLKKFSLEIMFIKNDEWEILRKFLTKQEDLEFLLLRLSCPTFNKERYLQQNVYLESALKTLNNKKSLTSLHIKSVGWSLEALSKGFSHLTTFENQLKSFSFEASDDTIFSKEKVWKRVEGLCSFIKNQKKSLVKLSVTLPIALEDRVVNEVAEAISNLRHLKRLEFSVNQQRYHGTDFLTKYFQEELQAEISRNSRQKLKISEIWNPNLAKYFKRLENLEDFELRFDIFPSSETGDWLVDVLKVLPKLEKLRKVNFRTESRERIESFMKYRVIAPILKELKNIREISLDIFDDLYDYGFNPSLNQMLWKKNESQALRCDLMF